MDQPDSNRECGAVSVSQAFDYKEPPYVLVDLGEMVRIWPAGEGTGPLLSVSVERAEQLAWAIMRAIAVPVGVA